MNRYAISDGKTIVNVIIAESKEIAEEVTGMEAIHAESGLEMSWTLEEEGWRPPPPLSSWEWNGTEWLPPLEVTNNNEEVF